jgi:hypothetical protein
MSGREKMSQNQAFSGAVSAPCGQLSLGLSCDRERWGAEEVERGPYGVGMVRVVSDGALPSWSSAVPVGGITHSDWHSEWGTLSGL